MLKNICRQYVIFLKKLKNFVKNVDFGSTLEYNSKCKEEEDSNATDAQTNGKALKSKWF